MNTLTEHLKTGTTTVCRAWLIERKDGVALGFTDHDCVVSFDGKTFSASGGMTATSLEARTGLSVDNGEALGVLSDAGIHEDDVKGGLFDDAEVTFWLVNWQDTQEREVTFRGKLGDVRTSGGQFHAELRGLTDQLNQPRGRTYQKGCSAFLGDGNCQVDLNQAAFRLEGIVAEGSTSRVLLLATDGAHDKGWFTRGHLSVDTGAAAGLSGEIKNDTLSSGLRRIELWNPLGVAPEIGATVSAYAGCDKRFDTCRYKFLNTRNFRGFPDLPGDDWMLRYPNSAEPKDGGSRR